MIVDLRDGTSLPALEEIRAISDRACGVGCDQFITIELPKDKNSDIFMGIYNADGSKSGACGNATRCVADIIINESGKDTVIIQTLGGLLECYREDDGYVCVDMGVPQTIEEKDLPLGRAVIVNIGNPHCIFFVDNIEDIPVEELGADIETHEFFPDRTNVEFAQIISGNQIRLRVWERGCGITHACGSGACATIVAAVKRGLISSRSAEIIMDGGSLNLEWREIDDHILMTGPVSYVFEGVI